MADMTMLNSKAPSRERTRLTWQELGHGSSQHELQQQPQLLFEITTDVLCNAHMPLKVDILSVLHQDREIEMYTGIGLAQVVAATITKIIVNTHTILQTANGEPHLVTNGHVKAACLNCHDKIHDILFKKDHVDFMVHLEDKDANDMDIIQETLACLAPRNLLNN